MRATARLLLVSALALATAGSRAAAQRSSPPSGYELAWSDGFERDGWPDPRNWTYERGFVRNNEHQWYQADNAIVKHGHLVIEARRESKPNPTCEQGSTDWRRGREGVEYTSASLSTRGMHSFRYGRFEMRARIDVRPGMWPAFWTLGNAGRWPANGETTSSSTSPSGATTAVTPARRSFRRASRSITCGSTEGSSASAISR